MLAEIHGKISRTGSNLSERLEDELTGNVFGNLRYLPFNIGLKQILCNALFPENIRDMIYQVNACNWSENIEFWPYDREGELDAYIEFGDLVIGIEAKYKSGISSDDGMDYSEMDDTNGFTDSNHQLQRESRIISERANGKDKVLLLVADALDCTDIFKDVKERNLLVNSDVILGYISWQSILRELRKLNISNPFHKVVVSDLIALLNRKEFEQFHSMNIESECPIIGNDYYKFDYMHQEIFDFTAGESINVNGGLYYEFE